MVPLNLAGVLKDPVEQGRREVLGVVVTESSGGSPLCNASFYIWLSIRRAKVTQCGNCQRDLCNVKRL